MGISEGLLDCVMLQLLEDGHQLLCLTNDTGSQAHIVALCLDQALCLDEAFLFINCMLA